MRKVQFLFSLKASLKQNHKCVPLTKKIKLFPSLISVGRYCMSFLFF